MTTAIESVRERSEEIQSGASCAERTDGKCRPPAFFPDNPMIDTAIAQGDLFLLIAEDVPVGYTKRTDESLQLVPGDTVGARHCLIAGSPCDVFDPPGFGPEYEELMGPFLVTTGSVEVAHPTHANVMIPGGTTVECRYQKTWDAEQRRERRTRD